MRSVRLLGIRIDALSLGDTLGWIDEQLAEGKSAFLNTLNVNLLLNVDRYPGMREIFNNNEANVADGMPLQWMARLKGEPLPGRVCGVDLMHKLCEASASRGYRPFLLGAREEVARKAALALSNANPGLDIAGIYSPPFREWDEQENETIFRLIGDSRANIILVAFGFPKQEYWIHRHKDRMPGCVFINVGGAFDLAAGMYARAPLWMQRTGLEWFWRVLQDPRRLLMRYLWDGLRLVPCMLKWSLSERSERKYQPRLKRN